MGVGTNKFSVFNRFPDGNIDWEIGFIKMIICEKSVYFSRLQQFYIDLSSYDASGFHFPW